jgi:hypothetical protein
LADLLNKVKKLNDPEINSRVEKIEAVLTNNQDCEKSEEFFPDEIKEIIRFTENGEILNLKTSLENFENDMIARKNQVFSAE